ncbi:hypothetical protein FRC05_005276 [Tulasnella sp. 425]|nr:hypothetical protein FRC05_005276 [Tulasnella sp. 425]
MSQFLVTSGITHPSSKGLMKESVVGIFWDHQLISAQVLNCPTMPVKTVADGMLVVDMLVFAFEHRLGTALVVISADPDLAYGLSLLKQRRFNVILISPSTIPSDAAIALKFQSDIAFTWEAILEDEGSSSIDLNGPPSPLDIATSQREQPARTRPEGEQIVTAQPTKETTKALSVRSPRTAATSSLDPERPSCDLRPPQSADSYNSPKRAPRTSPITEVVIPTHLYALIDLLAKAAGQRGWFLGEIVKRVGSSPKMAWGKE